MLAEADQTRRDAGGSSGSALGSAFGFDRDEESWLAMVREAESDGSLGQIGPYRLIREAGRGSQGSVYKAVQPGTGRVIAIKRLGAGRFATPGMRARFEREVRSLASLSHPGIVTVFGTEEIEGQRVLLMEWIEGEPIDAWARAEGGRPLRERLEQFSRVCDAIAHAHQRGVIHRDIKPSNVLVDTGRAPPEPRVLDFGLAKLLEPEEMGGGGGLAAAPSLTRTGGFLGTPAYAAPEQIAAGDAVDTRTDVYGLGVLLYQLLTDSLPFAPGGDLGRLLDEVREREPQPPSERGRGLSRELDAIALKALAKEPERRYQSVDALAGDVRRSLAGETVLAHPPTAAYHLRKFVRRHRAAVGVTLGLFAITLAFAVVAGTLAVRLASRHEELQDSLLRERSALAQAQEAAQREANAAEEARTASAQAQKEAQRHKAASDYLTRLMAGAGDWTRPGRSPAMVDVLKRAAADLDAGRLENQGEVEYGLRTMIGRSYYGLGLFPEAEAQFRRAAALAEQVAGPVSVLMAGSINFLGRCLEAQGRLAEAEACQRRNLSVRHALHGREAADNIGALANLAAVLSDQGRLAEAQGLYEHASELVLKAGQAPDPTLIRNIAAEKVDQGLYAEAEPGTRLAIEMFLAKPVRPDSLYRARRNLAVILEATGRGDEGEALLRNVIAEWTASHGKDHPEVAFEAAKLAAMLSRRGRGAEALACFEESQATLDQRVGPSHMWAVQARVWMGEALGRTGDLASSESALREAAAHAVSGPAGAERFIAESAAALGGCLLMQGRPDEAAQVAAEALAVLRVRPPPGQGMPEKFAAPLLAIVEAARGTPEPVGGQR